MSMRWRFALWLAALCIGLAGLFGAAFGVVYATADDEARARLVAAIAVLAPVIGFAVVMVVPAGAATVQWLFRTYVRPPLSLAEQVQLIASGNPGHRIALDAGGDWSVVTQTLNRLADQRARAQEDLAARVAEASARLEEERNRLAALMSELNEGVLVCNAEGRILLYNERAKAIFERTGDAGAPALSSGMIGLGRSIFAALDRDQVAHALDQIQVALDRGDAAPGVQFVGAGTGGQLLEIHMAPFRGARDDIAGIVFTLRDVTEAVSAEAARSALLQQLASGMRAPLASLRAAADNLGAFADMEAEQRERFVAIVAAEARVLSERMQQALAAETDALKASLVLQDMQGGDLVAAACRRIHARLGITAVAGDVDAAVWIKADGYVLVQAITSIARHLRDECGARELRLHVAAAERGAQIDIEAPEAVASGDTSSMWEALVIGDAADASAPASASDPAHSALTLHDVLDRHGGAAWQLADAAQGGVRLRIVLPAAAARIVGAHRARRADARPEYYDFDLFARAAPSEEWDSEPLAALSYTVFDTETTGLDPSQGDEIVSIGALRIVNGRLLKEECFDQLVDPGRPMSAEAIRIHGIDPRALAGQPAIDAVLPALQRFCADTVLVAHNAAFDLRFLQLKEERTGVRFTQPVLDTLLLSTVLHPHQTGHSLDVLAERFGVNVIGRHTALGDALVTGEVFLKMIPLLAQRGIVTLRDAREASRKSFYARLEY